MAPEFSGEVTSTGEFHPISSESDYHQRKDTSRHVYNRSVEGGVPDFESLEQHLFNVIRQMNDPVAEGAIGALLEMGKKDGEKGVKVRKILSEGLKWGTVVEEQMHVSYLLIPLSSGEIIGPSQQVNLGIVCLENDTGKIRYDTQHILKEDLFNTEKFVELLRSVVSKQEDIHESDQQKIASVLMHQDSPKAILAAAEKGLFIMDPQDLLREEAKSTVARNWVAALDD